MNLIIKEGISNETVLNALHQYDVYDNETEFYVEIVPKLNQKLKELGELSLAAEAFGMCAEKNIMILEDLSAKGYKPRSPAQGLNEHETKAVLRRAAAFHAICAVLQQEQPDIFANFKKGTFKSTNLTEYKPSDLLTFFFRTHDPGHECI